MTVPFRQLWLTSVSAGVFALTLASHALADDFVVDGPVTISQTVDGGDTLAITEDGSITTTGNSEHGVDSTGDQNVIINDGAILTSGNAASGINNTGDGAVIINNGSIETSGDSVATSGPNGIINEGTRATVINNGVIDTTDLGRGFSDGIKNTGDEAAIVNNGLIVAADDGIQNEGNGTTIINNGVIRTTGATNTAQGIVTATGSEKVEITNNGLIQAASIGIANNGNDSVITNSGVIQAVEYGIHSNVNANAVITNSGSIISETGYAIYVSSSSSAATLNLNAPSFLGGAITFESETTLNINTGASHSVLWQLPVTNVAGGQANVSGPVPWFYDSTTGQFATFDPTGLTASFNQMANTANMLGRLGRYGLRQAGRTGSAAPAALAYGEDGTQTPEGFNVLLATSSGPDAAYGLMTGSFWLTGFGGEANYDGDDVTLDYSIDQVGAALGYAWAQSPDMRLGVMAGYMNGSITAESTWADSQDISSNGVFAGLYGDRRFGQVTFGLGLAGGWQTNDSSRFVNDNTALTGGLTLGESTASSSYDSWFVTPEAALSADIALGRTGIIVTPSVRGRYALQQTGSYTETGSAAIATVDSHTFGVAEGDFELALSRSFGLATLTGRAGYLVRSSTGDDDVPVTLLGITNSIGLGATDRSAVYLGAGLDLNLGPQASFTLDGQGYLSDDVDALEGMARLSIRF